MSLIRLQAGSLAFGHIPLLEDVDLTIEPRERLCLVGRNGTGKSTLLNVLSGEQPLDSGRLWRRQGLKISKLAQEVPEAQASTVFDVVAAGLGDHAGLLARYHKASTLLANGSEKALEAFGELQSEVEMAGAWEGSQRIDAVLSRLALEPDALMGECSGGIRRRAMLGQALVSEPDLLLLDEPTNHLDIQSIEALEASLLNYAGAVLFVTHDRSLMDRIATRIIELDRGVLRSFPGRYAEYVRRREALSEAELQSQRKFDQTLAAEEVWIRQGIKARRTRDEGRVRRLESMRRERAQRIGRTGKVKMALVAAEKSGKVVLEAEKVEFGYAGEPLIRDFSTTVLKGDRIGIIGPNGSGKSTVLRILLGELEPSQGRVRLGTQLNIAYFDQERWQLDPGASVRDNVADGSDQVEIGGKSRHVISYLGDFLFPPARTRSPVSSLSGGERNRLLLAKLFVRPANLLVLDEPTNDLDIETLELLEQLLSEYPGTLLVVSHDRSFLDRTVTSTLVLSGKGHIEEHVGGYTDWYRYHQRMLDQRAEAEHQSAAARKSAEGARANRAGLPETPLPRPSAAETHKLSYKEQRELDELPAIIEALEGELAALQSRTQEPAFYSQPRQTISIAMQQLADIQARLQQSYERWETLEQKG